MNVRRFNHAAVLLPDGRVLVTGKLRVQRHALYPFDVRDLAQLRRGMESQLGRCNLAKTQVVRPSHVDARILHGPPRSNDDYPLIIQAWIRLA